MISQAEFGSQAMTEKKQAMPETAKFEGPSGLSSSSSENKFAANENTPIAKPGFSS